MNDNMNKNELKEKVVDYASKVFFYCIKRVRNRMAAEDLSQTILLEIIQNIDKGAHINNLDYYIWGVCKNQYNMYLRKTIKERNNLEYKEDIDEKDNSKILLDEMLEDEKIRRMNQTIKLLSKDYAEILYAYYVEDKTLKFIAKELNMPLGTAKWKLAEVRKKLKEYLGMEKINGKKAYVPKTFSGIMAYTDDMDLNIHDETSSLLVKNLLYHSYDNPCSIEDYSIELGVSITYIKDYVDKLTNMQLLKKVENNKYVTTIAFIDARTQREVLDVIRYGIDDYQNAVIEFAKEHIGEYKAMLEDNSIKDNLLMWTLIFEIINYSEHKGNIVYTKNFTKGKWEYYMFEDDYKVHPDEFSISCNQSKQNLNISICAFPSSSYDFSNEVGKRLKYGKAATGHFENIAIFNYILNNDVRYSDLEDFYKNDVKEYIKLGYFKVVDGLVKANVPVIDDKKFCNFMSEVRKNEKLKESFLKMYNLVRRVIEKNIPEYLIEQKDFIVSCSANTIRSLVISKAYEEGLLSFGDNDDYFVYNMYIRRKEII